MDFTPTRKVVHRGSKKHVGFFPSRKVGRTIAFESLLERDYFFLLEYDPEVILFCEQPLDIEYIHQGKKRHYYPDVAVERNGRIQIIELKPFGKLYDQELLPKINAAINYCNAKGYDYKIVTDKHINKQVLKNIKKLFKYANIRVSASIRLSIRAAFSLNEVLTIQQLCEFIEDKCGNYSKALAIVYSQLSQHALECDMSSPIVPSTYINAPAGGNN